MDAEYAEVLPAKAQSYLRRVERKLVETIGEQMDIPFMQRRGGLYDAANGRQIKKCVPGKTAEPFGTAVSCYFILSRRSTRLYSSRVTTDTSTPLSRLKGTIAYNTKVETLVIWALTSVPMPMIASKGIP